MQLEKITSKENAKLKAAAKLLQSKKERKAAGAFVAEGKRLCLDAFYSGQKPLRIFVTEGLMEQEATQQELAPLLQAAPERYLIPDALAHRLSDTQSPQGLFCVFEILDNSCRLATIKKNRLVILSSLQDPGNIGTIIRTCEAFGVDMVLMSDDCPDLYAPKTLRATMGGIFRLPVQRCSDLKEEILSLRHQGVQVYAAALHRDSLPITELDFAQPSAIVIGNEGSGLTDSIIEACTAPMIIPMASRAESLNAAVAATVAVWEMCRPRG